MRSFVAGAGASHRVRGKSFGADSLDIAEQMIAFEEEFGRGRVVGQLTAASW